jgi:polar amino acid transport system substrate-binding protein
MEGKKMKKLFALMLSLVMLVSLAACSSSSSNSSQSTGGSDENKATLVMATNAEFPPYEYYETGDGQVVGIDAEIAAAIADKLDMTLDIQDMNFDSILVAVQSGQADIGMAGMTITEDRLVNADFSVPYAEAHQVIIVKEDSDITGPDDLYGKQIGVQTNTTGDIYTTDDYGDDAIQRYNKGADAVAALSQGMIDAVVIDLEPAKSFVAANEGLKILDTEYATEEYAIAFAKGNTDLYEKVNTALQELIDDGTVQTIIDKYITAE